MMILENVNRGDIVSFRKRFGNQGGGEFVVCKADDPALLTIREISPDEKKGKPMRVGRKNLLLIKRAVDVGETD